MNFTLAFFKISVYSKDNLMSEDFRKLEEKGMSFTGSLKKTLAVVMSAAVLSTAGVMMASADATVNLMPADVSAIICGEGGTVETQDGSIVFKAGSADTSFTYVVTSQVDMLTTDYLYFDLTATGGWDIKWVSTALNGDVNPGVSADFGNFFGKDNATPETMYGTLLDAATVVPEDLAIQVSGAYTWNANLPDDGIVTMKSVEIKVGANSEITLNALYFGDIDGYDDVPGDPAPVDPSEPSETEPSTSETEPTTPPTAALVEKSVSLLGDAADWNYDSAAMTVAAGENGGLVFANTNGQWPSAEYVYDVPLTFDPKTAKISYDITVGNATNVNLFFKDSFPGLTDGENNFADDGYVSLSKYVEDAQLNGDDLMGVNTQYKGVIDLSQVEFPAGCLNDDGTVTLNAINIFSIGAADVSSVVYADLTLTYMAEADPQPTDPTTDDTTASTDATDSTAASNSTAATTGKQNPTTGESTAMIVAGLVLMAASAGAVALCAKKKAR